MSYGFNFGDIKTLQNIHRVATQDYRDQRICNLLTYTVCVLLFIPSVYVLVKMFIKKQYNLFLVSLTSILILGEVSGIATAYLV